MWAQYRAHTPTFIPSWTTSPSLSTCLNSKIHIFEMWGACKRLFTVKMCCAPPFNDSSHFFSEFLSFGGGGTSIFLTSALYSSYNVPSIFSSSSVGFLSFETNVHVTSVVVSRCTTFLVPTTKDFTRNVELTQSSTIQSKTTVLELLGSLWRR